MPYKNITVYGTTWCGDCKRAKKFLGEQMIHYKWVDIDRDPEARATVEGLNKGKRSVPTIVFEEDGTILVEPTNAQLAQKLGLTTQVKMHFYDLIIIGGGACGLNAASYARRERIETLLIERRGLGGQAAMTAQVENVPGFAETMTGTELAMQLEKQARRLGAEIMLAEVERIEVAENFRIVRLSDGTIYNANALLMATGAAYRKLNVPGEDRFIGAGAHYCTTCDAPFYKGTEQLLVVGGGHSAVEEALYLTTLAKRVTLVVRSDRLKASAAAQEKLLANPSVEIMFNTVVTELQGHSKLETVLTKSLITGQVEQLHPKGVFIFIGMAPNNWLVKDLVQLDPFGYILTGHDLVHSVQAQLQAEDPPRHIRMPHAMETSVRGVFVAGDVRAGSIKEVPSAVAEGASAAIAIREYLRGE